MSMTVTDYLKKPYGRVVIPDSDGSFRAEIIEFPGCIAVGDTAAEALANLEDVAAGWLEASIEKGHRVAEPIENAAFSGKLLVRLPKSLHQRAAHIAAREGVSLNQLIVSCLAEQVGAKSIVSSIGKFFALRVATSSVFLPANTASQLQAYPRPGKMQRYNTVPVRANA